MTSTASVLQSHCPDEKLVMLAEMAGINCIHLTSVSRDDAITALTGLALYHHLDPQSRREVKTHRENLPGPFRAALERAALKLDEGSVRWDHGNGSMQTAKGTSVDFETLGLRPNRIEADGHYIHYAIVDETFVLFRDDPSLWYYTQNTQQGRFNYWSAIVAKNATKIYASYATSKAVVRIPGIERATRKLNKKIRSESFYPGMAGLFQVQDHIPLWREIVGAPVPRSGTLTVLVYLSEDGQNWPTRARLDISPNGSVTTTTWNTQR
ncbi:MAG: hypothetical protein JJU06_17165 [Ectothiorhodospiraceae bacterium]|nr:hypothetical protein [Ectothiorhodospiraceae bacterium]MCH8504847.1 hypothetical protein [Ectothiorhodospiraceae bacterium]